MISLKRANQGGAVQTFFIVGLLLVIVTIGTARFVEQHGAQVRRDQAIALAEKQLKTDQASSNSGSTATNSSNTNSGQATPPSTSTSDSSAQSSATTTSTDAARSSALPTTGPSAASIVNIVLIGLLSAVTAAYLSSRRHLARSL